MMLCLNREEGGENNLFFLERRVKSDFLWVRGEQGDGVVSVSFFWNHQVFVTSLGLGLRFLLSGSHFLLIP